LNHERINGKRFILGGRMHLWLIGVERWSWNWRERKRNCVFKLFLWWVFIFTEADESEFQITFHYYLWNYVLSLSMKFGGGGICFSTIWNWFLQKFLFERFKLCVVKNTIYYVQNYRGTYSNYGSTSSN